MDLTWEPYELFGLLFFELLRSPAGPALNSLAREIGADAALSFTHRARRAVDEQTLLVNKLAGPFMGSNATRGKVYTWVPLHLSDARNACSPRSFLTAWQQAAQHEPAPIDRVVDHLGLNEGVRNASEFRLNELREDYRWIDFALGALKGEFVPIEKDALYTLWSSHGVLNKIISGANQKSWLTPVDVGSGNDRDTDLPALLETMKSIAVLEERSNGKINAPDIFRVEAGIKRKGGVAVPRKK